MTPLLQNGFAPLSKFAGLSWAVSLAPGVADLSTLLNNLRISMQTGNGWNQWVVWGNKYSGTPPRNGTKMPNAVLLAPCFDHITGVWVFLFYIEPSDVYVTPPDWPKVADSNAT